MKRMIIIFILILLSGLVFAEEYYIVTNAKTKVYETPGAKSKPVDYRFNEKEFVIVGNITNIKGGEWCYLPFLMKKQGWVERKNLYDFKGEEQNGDLYYRIFIKELVEDFKANKEYTIHDVHYFTNTSTNYFVIRYRLLEQYQDAPEATFYKLVSNDIKPVLRTSFNFDKIYFIDTYLILFEKSGIYVYNLNVPDSAPLRGFNRFKNLKRVSAFGLDRDGLNKKTSMEEVYDSYMEIDEAARELRVYDREKPGKPFKVLNFKFTDGKFEKE